jgi:hypothetical protein
MERPSVETLAAWMERAHKAEAKVTALEQELAYNRQEVRILNEIAIERNRLREAIEQVLAAYDEAGLSNIGAAVTLRRALTEGEDDD